MRREGQVSQWEGENCGRKLVEMLDMSRPERQAEALWVPQQEDGQEWLCPLKTQAVIEVSDSKA